MDLVTTIILAGGKSERMGTDKALLQLNHKTLLQLTCEAAACCSDRILIVSSECQSYAHLPLPTICQFVSESLRSSPLQAFYLAMAWLSKNIAQQSTNRSNWLLLLACDLPNLKGEMLQIWTQQLAQLKNYDAYLAVSDRPSKKSSNNNQAHLVWEPLCGFYHFNCYQFLTDYLAGAKTSYSFQDWLSQLNICPIKNVPAQMLFNCNYYQDWQKILANYEDSKLVD